MNNATTSTPERSNMSLWILVSSFVIP
ncbi:hypothetical protein MNBD_GAMMA07-1207, partial [hydrothermal vent metagenome]